MPDWTRHLRPLALLSLSPLIIASPATAHHSPALFDQGRDLTLQGVVTRFEWANPHVYLYVETKDNVGPRLVWIIDAQSPRVMSLFGWSPGSLAAGDRVTVATNPARNGDGTRALGRSVVRPDGTVLKIPWAPGEVREALRTEPGRNAR